jgi:hypothetical protein
MLIANIANGSDVAQSFSELRALSASPWFSHQCIPWCPPFLSRLASFIAARGDLSATALGFLGAVWSLPARALAPLTDDRLLDAVVGCVDSADPRLLEPAWAAIAALSATLSGLFLRFFESPQFTARVVQLFDSPDRILRSVLNFLISELPPQNSEWVVPHLFQLLNHPSEKICDLTGRMLSSALKSEAVFVSCMENDELPRLLGVLKREWRAGAPLSLFECCAAFAERGIVEPFREEDVLRRLGTAVGDCAGAPADALYRLIGLLAGGCCEGLIAAGVARAMLAVAEETRFENKVGILRCLCALFERGVAVEICGDLAALRFVCGMVEAVGEGEVARRVVAVMRRERRLVEIAREGGLLESLQSALDGEEAAALLSG